MKKFRVKKAMLLDLITLYTIQHSINLFSEHLKEEKVMRDYHVNELNEWIEKLIQKGIPQELIERVIEKCNEYMDKQEYYLYDAIVSCGVELY